MDKKVLFNEPQIYSSRLRTPHESKFEKIIIGLGLATDSKKARTVLLVIAAISFLIAISLPFLLGGNDLPDDGKGYEIAGPNNN